MEACIRRERADSDTEGVLTLSASLVRGNLWSLRAIARGFALVVGVLTLHSADAQDLSPPMPRAFNTEYTEEQSGFVVANARSGECSTGGVQTQRIEARLGGKTVAVEQDSGAQRGLQILVPVPKGGRWRVDLACAPHFSLTDRAQH